VTVRDTIPPTITAAASPSALWPPNHKMWNVNATAVARDSCDPSPAVTLFSAASNEPNDGDDIQGAAIGAPDFHLQLRAERDGGGTGRVYALTYKATDRSDNGSTASALVNVPHDMRDKKVEPIDVELDGARSTVVLWGAVDKALYYDVIRGDLANLTVQGLEVDLGIVHCIANHTTATTTIGQEDTAIPAPGHVWFYATQYTDATGSSSYGTESSGKALVVRPGNGDCR
jgi:hypothetical protein